MEAWMPWLIFAVTTVIMVITANKLAEYGDVISVHTGMGGMLVGTILLAGATSLPELLASISAFRIGSPDLAAGNFFGSNMVNIALLAIVDLLNVNVPLLHTRAVTHTLTAALAAVLAVVAVIFVLADVEIVIGWVGIESIVLILLYFAGLWAIQKERGSASAAGGATKVVPGEGFPSLRRGVVGFAVAALVLILIVPQLVNALSDIAAQTGLGESFIGTTLLSVATSLPELLASWAAVRIGAVEMAVGNLFGSNVFNMFAISMADFFYAEGSFLNAISDDFALVGLLGVLLTMMALIGNISRVERRVLFVELDAVAILVMYILGLYLLYQRGM
jgi:cation:H+ antiporter